MTRIQKNKQHHWQTLFYHLLILAVTITLTAFSGKIACAGDVQHLLVEKVMDIKGEFNQPTEVAISEKGHIFVLDGANGHVAVFNQTGEMLYTFGKAGSGDDELKNPVGLGLDLQDMVYVADTGNQRIQIFNHRGKYIRKIDLSLWDVRPVEVTISEKTGQIYVSDAKNHQILCFDSGGVFKFAWGRYGEDLGEFKFPGMTCVDARGNLLVVDILNGRIQVSMPDGKNPSQLGTLGILPGQLFRPKGIVLDPQSRIFVSDSYTGIIQAFNPDGSLYGILSQESSEFLRLMTPIGMAFDKNGRLYIVQASSNIISVFQLIDKK